MDVFDEKSRLIFAKNMYKSHVRIIQEDTYLHFEKIYYTVSRIMYGNLQY